MTEPAPLAVHKVSHYVELPVDTDGTPLIDGDRCVEVAPGQWAHPVAVAIAEMLDAGLGLPTP